MFLQCVFNKNKKSVRVPCLLPVPLFEAFALPINVERATQKPHADMYITNHYTNS